jgi:hypothetical protein
MENNEITDPDLKDVSFFLREQAELCHALTKSVFDAFCKEPRPSQEKTLKMMTRLINASAVAANAMNRIKGTQIHQTITIRRMERQGLPSEASQKTSATTAAPHEKEGASPQNAKTNSPA